MLRSLGTNNLDHPKKMPSDSQSSPAGLHEVAIGLAVVVGVCVLIGATLNVIGVVTAYWIVFSYKGNSANVGLWRICEQQTSGDIQCDYISDPPTAIGLDDYVYASRSLAVGAAVSCVVSVLIAVVGLIERKKALVFSAAAILFLQSIGFSIGLAIFIWKFRANVEALSVDVIDVVPGWSIYVGGVGAFMYFIGGFALCCLPQWMHMHGSGRHDGPAYRPLQEDPPAVNVSTCVHGSRGTLCRL